MLLWINDTIQLEILSQWETPVYSNSKRMLSKCIDHQQKFFVLNLFLPLKGIETGQKWQNQSFSRDHGDLGILRITLLPFFVSSKPDLSETRN
ncbi:hypothetical protein CDAR_527211 [Caerostris darwini]|uniref:Uncharacterized protein n=2 Tax=Caerostris TaxID=172845 RepID=A0AAV4WKR1_9ARAC|nr:hypothetical protein CEXT_726861 [Caerostris extrusa]GIY82913.1 hypothetical protein CDAR_527211 [Caerostris darwini]